MMNIITGNLLPDNGYVAWKEKDIRTLGADYRSILGYAISSVVQGGRSGLVIRDHKHIPACLGLKLQVPAQAFVYETGMKCMMKLKSKKKKTP